VLGACSPRLSDARAERLPMPYHPVFNVGRSRARSRDRFFLCIESTDPKFDRTPESFLKDLRPLGYLKLPRKRMTQVNLSAIVLLSFALIACRQECTTVRATSRCARATSSRGSSVRMPVANTVVAQSAERRRRGCSTRDA